METLFEVLDRIETLGRREAVRVWDGYRRQVWSYRDLLEAAEAAAEFLRRNGVGPADRVLLWGENRPEWAAAFWGCVWTGATAVPVDYRSSPDLTRRIAREAGVKFALCGDDVDAAGLEAPTERLARLPDRAATPQPRHPATGDDVVEIVYTSGSTSAPRGVVHRHRNLCSNLSGIADEIDKYRWAAAPFQPIRLLDLLPLSHLFGQTMGLYMPVLLGGAVVFTDDLQPAALIEMIRRERVSVVTAVPALVASLRGAVEKQLGGPPEPVRRTGWGGIPETWWRYRSVHARLGWKFWAFVVGGAQLDDALEAFWRRLGYAVIQGYGLTEASPVVAVNHPFSPSRGSIGKAVAGQEVKLAPDGEILVRGPAVVSDLMSERSASEGGTYVEDGWLHTGDLGEIDSEGRLFFRGRKKDLIVKPDGLNVFPHDVEEKLLEQPEVAEACVVGVGGRVHAALVPASADADLAGAVKRANEKLEPHQRVQERSLWAAEDLPRTPSTFKIRRGELVALLTGEQRSPEPSHRSELERLLDRDLPGGGGSRLEEDLGLSSLDRIELLSRVEEQIGAPIDETRFAAVRTVDDLQALLTAPRGESGAEPRGPSLPGLLARPRWNRTWFVVGLRRGLQEALFFPLSNRLMQIELIGGERLEGLKGPVIFVANHSSHFDALAILRALPRRWRRRVAPAMSQDFFGAWFGTRRATAFEKLRDVAGFLGALGLFNAYPLPQRLSGTRQALRYTAELVDEGWCPLVFPEGTRSPDARLLPFRPGIGLMAQSLHVPVVPLRIQGTFEIYPPDEPIPVRRGVARVTVGSPLDLSGFDSYEAAAAQVERAVRALE